MLFQSTVPHFIKILRNLSAMLDKAEAYAKAKKFEPDVFVNIRLAPDQFPLGRQIQIAADTARLGCSRLVARDPASFDDNEKTLEELKGRIDRTIAALSEFTEADFVGAAERRIGSPRWAGKTLSGEEFTMHHMIPNFYFHVTTAYAILRANGVDVGKMDYLGAMPFREPAAS